MTFHTTFLRGMFVSALLMTLFLSQAAFGQGTGTIKGRVSEQGSNEPLPGANIIIVGTSIGTTSDIYGNYTVRLAPLGARKLKVSFLGYKTLTVDVNVTSGEVTKEIHLVAEALTGEEVVVTAQARGQNSAINQQLASPTMVNIVSSDKIRELPDASAASALSRLPGVSLMNGDQVVIRGVQAKLNAVMINGIQLPSTDMNNRSTNLGFISSNMLSGIEVVKTITSDMDANTIGGVVNLKLREAAPDFRVELFAQGGYNTQDHTSDNSKMWLSVSDRLFDDKFGFFIQGNADRTNGGGDRASAGYQGVSNGVDDWSYGEMNSFTFSDGVNKTDNNGVNVLLDYKLPHGKIVVQNSYAHNSNNNLTSTTTLNFTPNGATYNANRQIYGKDLYINALQAENTFGDIKVEFTASHSLTTQYTRMSYGNGGENFSFVNANMDPFGLNPDGTTRNFNKATLTPDDVYGLKILQAHTDSAQLGGWLMRRDNAFTQRLYNTSLDVSIPLNITPDITSVFKIGGKAYRTTRTNDVNSWFTGSGDPDAYDNVHNFIPGKTLSHIDGNRLRFGDVLDRNYLDERGQYFLGGKYAFNTALDAGKYDDFLRQSISGWVSPMHYGNSYQDDFNGAELFTAGYAMGTFNVGPRITVIGGVRYENYNMKYNANFTYVTHSVYGDATLVDTLNTVDRSDHNIFPNVQVRYKITDWADIRAAYSQGISRPDYSSIIPKTIVTPGSGGTAGNTILRPALSTNLDFAISTYYDKIGLLTVSPFFKKITDMFYTTSIYYKNMSSFNASFPDSQAFVNIGATPPNGSERINTSVNNSNPGYVSGIEFDWQSNFWYLPKPFNALVANINYTKSWSDMEYNQIINYVEKVREPGPRPIFRETYLSRDTTYKARLLFQANDVVNIAMGIDYKDFSGRISFNMQGNVITGISSSQTREGDQYTGNTYRWDFTMQQKLPIEGMSLMLSGVNIFHNPVYTYQKFKRLGQTEVSENLVSTAYYPTTFELTLRYSM